MLSRHDRLMAHVSAMLGLLDSAQVRRAMELVECHEAETLRDAIERLHYLDAGEVAALDTIARTLGKRHELDVPPAVIFSEAPAPKESDHAAGPTELGSYDIIEAIGRGAAGTVYRGRKRGAHSDVALKVILARDAAGEDVQRFEREAATITRLDHPNIVKVFDYGSEGSYHYYVMEYLRGRSLRALIDKRGFLSPYEAAEYMRDAALGLAYAHGHGIIHRDVKPSNLMLTESGEIKVVDFGLAYEQATNGGTTSGLVPGTPAYMAPEQIEASFGRLGERTDVYALGITLYETLTGERPFKGRTHYEVMQRVLFATVTPAEELKPSLPREVCDIVRRAMARQPGERYRNMDELLTALDHFIDAGGNGKDATRR